MSEGIDWPRARRSRGLDGSYDPDQLAVLMKDAWARGRPVLVEAFLEQLAGLRDDHPCVQRLIDTEYDLRLRHDAKPRIETYPPRLSRWSSVPGFPCCPALPDQTEVAAKQAGGAIQPNIYGTYALLANLGRGGQATVHLARDDALLNRHVALKIYQHPSEYLPSPSPRAEERSPPDSPNARAANERATLRLQREMWAAGLPAHPALARIQRTGRVGETVYLDMEFIPGPSLAIYTTADRLLAPREAARIIAHLASGLSVLHGCEGVHRDIKPDNVLFNRSGLPVLIDYGLAMMAPAGEPVELSASAHILGTWLYMPPEAANGDYSIATDIATLGAVLYHLLTGRLPYPISGKPSQAELLTLLLERRNFPPKPPHLLRPAIGRELSLVCLRMIGWVNGERTGGFASMYEVADQLTQATRIRRWGRAALASVLLVGTGLSGVVLGASSHSSRPVPGRMQATDRHSGTLRGVYSAMEGHLRTYPDDADVTRFVRLEHLNDNPSAKEGSVSALRDALKQTLRLVAGKPVVLEAANPDMTLLALNLETLGWNAALWEALTENYPYALHHKVQPAEETVNALARYVCVATGTDLPAVRGDWLLAELTTPQRARALRGRFGRPLPPDFRFPPTSERLAWEYRATEIDLATGAADLGLPVEELRYRVAERDTSVVPKLQALIAGKNLTRNEWEGAYGGVAAWLRLGTKNR